MARLEEFLKTILSYRTLYLDTNIFIYHLEDVSPYSDLTALLFEQIESRHITAFTSVLSLMELNVRPYQLNEASRALTHIALLKNLPHLHIREITLEIADRAAQLRAKYRLTTPDALHLSSALQSNCQAFLGNDKDLKVPEVPCLVLDRFL